MGVAISIIAIALTLALSTLLWLISARHAARFVGRERVIMNWSFTGEPNSYASPRVALSVTPAIGTATLLLIGGLVAFATPLSERAVATLMIVLAGVALIAIHAAHMHFAAKAADR